MYDFIDRPLSQLDEGSRFLTFSMRLWVSAIALAQCPAPAIAPLFARWRAIGALPYFHRAMALFNRDAVETFRFCSLGCAHVSEHEAIVLSLLCTLRDRQPAMARDTLALIVAEEAIGDLIGTLSQLVGALGQAGMLPRRPCAAGSSAIG